MARLPTISPRALRRLTGLTLLVTALIVVTGGAVRLTASGLGCPTWPNCRTGQLDSSGLGLKGAIEFGNRVITVAITLVVAATAVAAFSLPERRRDLRVLSAAMVLGILANAVIGGLTVRTHLNPGLVAVHFLFNMALLVVALALHARAGWSQASAGRLVVGRETVLLARLLTGVAFFVLVAGTLATGSGPHGGDAAAPRFHIAPLDRITALHADAAMVLVGVVVAVWVVARVTDVPAAVRRRSTALAVVVAGQALLGFAQYLLGLPAVLVLAHIAGATVLWLLAVSLLRATREHPAPPAVAATPEVARRPARERGREVLTPV